MSNPFVIITLGPTGAGKSRLVEKTIEDCGLAERAGPIETFPVFRVDDLVTQRQEYKDAITNLSPPPQISRQQTAYEDFADTYSSFMTNMGIAYLNSRKKQRCYNETDEAIFTPDSRKDHDRFYKIIIKVLEKKISKAKTEIDELQQKQKTQDLEEKEKEKIKEKIEKETKELNNLEQELQENKTKSKSEGEMLDSSTKTMNEKTVNKLITAVTTALTPYDCTKINDLKILRAISKGISFSFEITGQFYPKHYLSWFQTAKKEYPKELNYDIYISGVFVPSFSELLKRNLSRFKQESEKYKNQSANSAPRLPDLTHIMHDNIETIIKNIKKMHGIMIVPQNEENITRMLLYSNIDKETGLRCEFDSLNELANKNINEAVDLLYNIKEQSQETVAKDFYRDSFSKVLKDMSSPPPVRILGSIRIGGRRRTSKTYKQRRRTQKKRNNKRNYNTKKTRNKRRKR